MAVLTAPLLLLTIALQNPQPQTPAKPTTPPIQSPVPPAKPASDKVMAKVNGTSLTAADVEPYLWDWRATEVLEDLVLLKIAEDAAKKASVGFTPQELDDRIAKELAQLQAGNYDAQKLKEQGFPMSRIVLKIKTALLLEKITLANFKSEDWAQISTIDFKPESTSLLTWGKVSREANATYAKLQKGVLWEKVKPQDAAADHWVPVLTLAPEIAAKIKSAPEGMVFPPRQNAGLIQITRLVSWGGKLNPAALNDLRAFYIQQNRNAVLNKIKEDAKVERVP